MGENQIIRGGATAWGKQARRRQSNSPQPARIPSPFLDKRGGAKGGEGHDPQA